MSDGRWQVWIDRGGTFTDCLGVDPSSGELKVAKVLSGDDAPIRGVRALLGLEDDQAIPPVDLRMGTTIATNALLERKGVPTLLAITEGFADLLEIGNQTRPDLFALNIDKPAVLHREVLEVQARATPDGNVLAEPEPEPLRDALRAARERGMESLAVVLMHAYRHRGLETLVGQLAAEAGFEHVALSSEVDDEIGLVARGDTTVVDAYLTPLLRDYLRRLSQQLPGSRIRVMQSSGVLIDAARFRGRAAILSGPAGGVVACAHLASLHELGPVIGFDMGGTSTDVCRYAGELERVYETEVAGVRLRAPMMAVHTVAAGGGSICRYDGGRLTVGPESAGSDPGPLAYGRPGAEELTLTDVNVALGRLPGDRFPFPLRHAGVDRVLLEIGERMAADGITRTPAEIATGFFQVGVENMAAAIREVSVARGHDVRDHAMVVFGGAGGQHACAVARALGMRRLVFHPLGGVLSAWGMGLAPVGWHGETDGGRVPLEQLDGAAVDEECRRLEVQGRAALADEGIDEANIGVRRRADLRYEGTETNLTVDADDLDAMRAAFEAAHVRAFGYVRPEHPIVVAVWRVEVTGGLGLDEGVTDDPRESWPGVEPLSGATPTRTAAVWMDGVLHPEVPVWEREELGMGNSILGPALILEPTATLVIEPGWRATVMPDGAMMCHDQHPALRSAPGEDHGNRPDPVLLEVFNNRFMSIAEQMGTVLRRTSLSTNIRERLDFSCAVFDEHGGLVANAPHIPVHLGAMSESVRAVLEAHPDPRPGDAYVTNDPAAGGSHLPDITVVNPVHDPDGRLRFFVASRGHHADVGGITPGSMPPFSRTLEEEGVVLRALPIVRAGALDREGLLELLRSGPYPARDPEGNLADLEAQLAANRKGLELLRDLVAQYGEGTVERYMQHVQDNAAARVAEAILRLPEGRHEFVDRLDDGAEIRVALTVDTGRLAVDFTGTSPQLDSNLNAPRAVTVAAVLYVLRTLVGQPIPLNGGCLRPVTLTIPPGSMLDPEPDRAVAAGNVETSQRVVDVLLGAIGEVAASQGTMNNLTFGTDRWGYYETIGGGAGAGRGFAGASGVHTHMTNTRITDPEILEARFPVRMVRFALRRGSGGAGQWPGGDGLVRELEMLEPVKVSILSERREVAPFGLEGGEPGTPGRNLHQGNLLPAKVVVDVMAGERICIETPGGGGFGPAPEEEDSEP